MNNFLFVISVLLISLLSSCEKEEINRYSFIPTVFSPNGDNINDVFYPSVRTDILVDYQMEIFDKYGHNLFSSSDISVGWPGQNKDGEVYPEDIYIYNLFFKFDNMEEARCVGNVRLVK